MKKILDNAIVDQSSSKLINRGRKNNDDLTGHYIRNIVNNICSNKGIKYLEIGLYRGGIFSSALFQNNIRAVGIDNWSQNWHNGESKLAFWSRIEPIIETNDVKIIDSDCWAENLLGDEKFNVYTFDGPHGWQDQYNALTKYIHSMEDEFIYIVDDYDKEKSPEVIDAVQSSIVDLNLNILCEYTMSAGDGYHEGIYFSCLEKTK
jgi:hypothetical protein